LARFERVDGILLEPLGEIWAAYSPASGETTLLNNESAALLEVLSAGPVDEAAVCAALAEDCDLPAAELAVMVGCHWSRLIEAGLVRTRVADRLPTA
jgi:PqqD family protein of HPr-rel-A system